jgi:hypothetical protein
MPKYTKEREKLYIERIRSLLVRNPQVSILEIKAKLAEHPKEPLNLDKDYINRLVRKIEAIRAQKLNWYTINEYLANFEEEIGEIKKRCWGIIQDADASHSERLSAMRELRTSTIELFEKMMEGDVFQRSSRDASFLNVHVWAHLKPKTRQMLGTANEQNEPTNNNQ